MHAAKPHIKSFKLVPLFHRQLYSWRDNNKANASVQKRRVPWASMHS